MPAAGIEPAISLVILLSSTLKARVAKHHAVSTFAIEAMAIESELLSLPGEIRELIYTKLLSPVESNSLTPDGYKQYRFDLRVLRINRQVYSEARQVFRRLNVFAAIETPFPEAENHVRFDVPLVITGPAALRFHDAHLSANINLRRDVPQLRGRQPQRFVVLRDDLPAFCRMWFYQDLGHPGLNAHLTLALELRDPYAAEYDAGALPKALQRQLLEPFGCVKGLDSLEIKGEHYESIEKALRADMAVPYQSPEQCLAEGNRIKDDGNVALQHGRYAEAIRLYLDAFRAIHIVCEGRRRSVWADAFFQKELAEGEHKGVEGTMVRFVLRARLVANVVLAYLKLADYEEAHFWGSRTIRLIQKFFDEESQATGFPAVEQMGKIYYRTALAAKELGDKSEARRYLAMALKYLPNDQIVRKERESLALPLM